jgi:hypothetical protein
MSFRPQGETLNAMRARLQTGCIAYKVSPRRNDMDECVEVYPSNIFPKSAGE